ncbi:MULTISPECIES: hypothetical protein [unclassified Deinococcus]|uniref:hypothetical protein n=1 Tax=unclassified Deinococcus TaxID=2623546 RepID=UPI001C899D48|nr:MULTISPECIES: hypothetical protein [unclassified Deinococcus]MBX8464303.1 hypothetical protein [Deinococcus sp. RIT780]MCD0164645.1 hypothetical protein [Deinococcus sp. 12RED42]
MLLEALLVIVPAVLILALIKANKSGSISKLIPYLKYLNGVAVSLALASFSQDLSALITLWMIG